MFLIRDLVSPRTWLAFTHHLAGWVVGVVFFLIVAFGIAIGLGSLPLTRTRPRPASTSNSMITKTLSRHNDRFSS
jgi:hypothetical protein